MSKKEKKEASQNLGDPEAWMDTLSDLIFLMITFFVLLISMSSMDSKALKAAFGFFDDATSVLKFPATEAGAKQFLTTLNPLAAFAASKDIPLKEVDFEDRSNNARKLLQGIADGLMKKSSPEDLMKSLSELAKKVGSDVQVIKTEDGVEVVLAGRLVFPKGDDTINEQGLGLLEDVAVIIELWGGEVEVIAMWNWYEGPSVLSKVAGILEKMKVRGSLIFPELFPSVERKIRFVMRQEKL